MADGEVSINVKEGLINNQQLLLLALREGVGLSKACEMSQNSVEEISLIMNDFPKFRIDCESAIKAGRITYLAAAGDYAAKGDTHSAMKARTEAERMKDLVLWETFCTRRNATARSVAAAFLLYKDGRETATACGFTWPEYVQFVHEHDNIAGYVEGLTDAKLI